MFFECTAQYAAFALLSRLGAITSKQERDVVQFILQLIPCYDMATGRLRMTRDAHTLAQIYLAELRVLAGWHGYTHEGSLEDPAQARTLLSVIVLPLVRHLSEDEYMDIVDSIEEAELLLSADLGSLNSSVGRWMIAHSSLLQRWRTYPIDGGAEWHYGCPLKSPFRIEDIVSALPYPLKPEWRETQEIGAPEVSRKVAETKAGEKDRGKWRGFWRRQKRAPTMDTNGRRLVKSKNEDGDMYIPLPISEGWAEPSSSAKGEPLNDDEWEVLGR